MVDVKQMLQRQAEWQKGRRLLPWPEKLRLAEAMRDTLSRFASLRASESRERRPVRRAGNAGGSDSGS